MISTRSLRVVLSIGVLAATGLTSGLVGVASASAAATPKVVVTPATNLHNGEKVVVTGSGFTSGDSVYIVECLANASGQAGCNILSAVPATISASGKLPRTTLKITTGKVGTGKCGTTAKNLKNCAVSVGNITGGDSAVARITFKALKKK